MTSSARRPRFALLTAALVVVAGVLAGCTGSDDATSPDPNKTTDVGARPQPPVEATPVADPVFVAGGTAQDNLPFFTKIVNDQWAAGSGVDRNAYINALVAGGFDKATMEAGASKTTLGNDVESLQFSVLWQGQCLLGQVGSATGDPIATVLPELADGGCFVAVTPPIE